MRNNLVTLTNENAADLKGHLDKYGFDWMYAVAPTQVVREIGDLYTQQFLNPTSTPILIIDRHGMAHPLPFGIKSANDLLKQVNMYLRWNVVLIEDRGWQYASHLFPAVHGP